MITKCIPRSRTAWEKDWQSFSELAFQFTLTTPIAVKFATAMGVIGGFLPAVRAARLNIVDAFKTRSYGAWRVRAMSPGSGC